MLLHSCLLVGPQYCPPTRGPILIVVYVNNAYCSYARRSNDLRNMPFCLASGDQVSRIEVDLL